MTNTIYASFTDPAMAEKTVGALLDHGIKSDHISVVFPEGYKTQYSNNVVTGQDIEDSGKKGISTTTGGDAAAGAAKGAGVGLAAGALAALAAIFVPGFGLVLGGGTLAIAAAGVAGATASGAVAGGVTGFLKDQGVPDDVAANYHNVITSGGALLTVTPTDEKVTESTILSVIAKYNGNQSTYPAITNAPGMAVVDTTDQTTVVR